MVGDSSLYQDIDKLYRKVTPKFYHEQKKEYYKINKNLRIPIQILQP